MGWHIFESSMLLMIYLCVEEIWLNPRGAHCEPSKVFHLVLIASKSMLKRERIVHTAAFHAPGVRSHYFLTSLSTSASELLFSLFQIFHLEMLARLRIRQP
jgi:hypothetical protein